MLPSQSKPKKLAGPFLLCALLFISFLTTSAAEGAMGERERAAAMSAIITQLLLSDAPLDRPKCKRRHLWRYVPAKRNREIRTAGNRY